MQVCLQPQRTANVLMQFEIFALLAGDFASVSATFKS